MATSLITCTPAGSTDNSYIELEDADKYFKNTLFENEWKSNSDNEKERALISATQVIEGLGGSRLSEYFANKAMFHGSPSSQAQVLHFPRTTDIDNTGSYVVPQMVRNAVCEQAFYMLQEKNNPDPLPVDRMRDFGLNSISMDGISTSWIAGRRPSGIAPKSWVLMKGYVKKILKTVVGSAPADYSWIVYPQ